MIFRLTCFAIAALAGMATNIAAQAAPDSANKVAIVFDVGGLGDKSFNDAAYAGLQKAVKDLGVQGLHREPGEGAHREAHLRSLARGDTDLIIGIGFLFTDEITGMAEDFPKKKFACVDYSVGGDIPENLRALTFREEEGAFLVGMIAALKSKTGKIGFVGGVQSPLIKKFELGYAQGAKHARADVQVRAVYAGVADSAFADPPKGKELASTLIDGGVDVLFHASGSTGLGVLKAAEERKVFAIGVDADQSGEAAPGVVITSMIKNTDTAVFNTCRDLVQGKFTGGVSSLGLKEGGLSYVFNEKNKDLLGDEIRSKVEAAKADIISGKITVKSR